MCPLRDTAFFGVVAILGHLMLGLGGSGQKWDGYETDLGVGPEFSHLVCVLMCPYRMCPRGQSVVEGPLVLTHAEGPESEEWSSRVGGE